MIAAPHAMLLSTGASARIMSMAVTDENIYVPIDAKFLLKRFKRTMRFFALHYTACLVVRHLSPQRLLIT